MKNFCICAVIGELEKYEYLVELINEPTPFLRLYIPNLNPSIYDEYGDIKYRLSLNIVEDGIYYSMYKEFFHGSALACTRFRHQHSTYDEYIDLDGEGYVSEGIPANLSDFLTHVPSSENYTLHLVLDIMDGKRKSSKYDAGQGSIILNDVQDHYRISISIPPESSNEYLKFYGPIFTDDLMYDNGEFWEILDVNEGQNVKVVLCLADKENIYNKIEKESQVINICGTPTKMIQSITVKRLFSISDECEGGIFNRFNSIPQGLRIQGIVSVESVDPEVIEQKPLLGYVSQPILVDNITFKYLNDTPYDVTIKNICDNMPITLLNINDVNEIKVVEQKTIKDNTKHIVQPIFYRVRDLELIVIHPATKENICINLEPYKAASSMFSIKIEGVVFKEIARLDNGVVFNINGSLLPKNEDAGVYYILNNSGDLISTGKYMYEY